MDEELRALEREAGSDPANLTLLRTLVRASDRAGWTHEDRSIDDVLQEAVSRSDPDLYDFDCVARDFADLQSLGLRALPGLIDAYEGGSLVTAWRAGLALGELGSNAMAALPTLVRGLSREHLLLRLLARWSLARLAPIALPDLVSRLERRSGDRKTLLDAVVFMGRQAQSARPLLEEWAANATGTEVDDYASASDLLMGHGRERIPSRIEGPSYWFWEFESDSDPREFDLEVWSREVMEIYHLHADDFDLGKPASWLHPDLEYAREALLAWRPSEIVLRTPRVRLRYWSSDAGAVSELTVLRSTNGADFTQGELFFGAERALTEEENPDAMGLEMDREDSHSDCPTYFVGVKGT